MTHLPTILILAARSTKQEESALEQGKDNTSGLCDYTHNFRQLRATADIT